MPDKEGSVTNVEIAKRYAGTGGEAVPLLPVVTLPAGKTVESPGVRSDLAKVDATLEQALPGARIASYASTGDRVFTSKDGRTVYALVYPTGADEADFGNNTDAARDASRGAGRRDRRRRADPRDGLRCAGGRERRRRGPGRARRGDHRRGRRARGAALRLRLVPRGRADRDGDRVDHDHVRAAARAHRADRRVADRAVPDRADRAGRRDRLRAARGLALARGARPRPQRRRGRAAGDGVGGPRRRVQRRHRRHRPARAGRAAAAVPALDGLRRDADPAGLDARRDHAAPGGARDGRPAARLAAPAHGRQGQPRVDALGGGGLAPALAVGRGRACSSSSRSRAPRSTCGSASRTPPRSRSRAARRRGSTRSSAPGSARARWPRTRS